MKSNIRLLLAFILLLTSFSSKAEVCETTRDFAWGLATSPASWSCGRTPGFGDIIIIRHKVTINRDFTISGGIIKIQIAEGGLLSFVNNAKLRLDDGSGIVIDQGAVLEATTRGNEIIIGAEPVFSCSSTLPCRLFGPGFLGTYFTPLPIELLSFEATLWHNQVKLTWITVSETGNDYFTLERSRDCMAFDSIGSLFSRGDSKELQTYNFTDENPMGGIAYYRLKQTDYDKKFSYSKIVTIQNEKGSFVEIDSKGEGRYWLYLADAPFKIHVQDVRGSRAGAALQVGADGKTATIDLSACQKGIYILLIEYNKGKNAFKLHNF